MTANIRFVLVWPLHSIFQIVHMMIGACYPDCVLTRIGYIYSMCYLRNKNICVSSGKKGPYGGKDRKIVVGL